MRVPKIRPTAIIIIATRQRHDDGSAATTQCSILRLTPPLGRIVLLHHQWDHVQLLLMSVVGLQSTLRYSRSSSRRGNTHSRSDQPRPQ
jgi:hypothetical protein